MAGEEGLEPSTFGVKFHCSNQLNYSPIFLFLVAGEGLEPSTQGYEPCKLPLLYPAILLVWMEGFEPSTS